MAKTIADYQEECRRIRAFHEEYDSNPTWVFWDLAALVLESLGATGSPRLFTEVEEEVRRIVLRDLRHYKRTGRRQLCLPHADKWIDGREEARAGIAVLVAAGLVSPSMANIAVPVPRFMGLELIEGSAPLRERLLCDDELLDVELVALAREVANPLALSQSSTMSLQITEHGRQDVDARTYTRPIRRSFVATFALRGPVSFYFWPRFTFGFINRLRVKAVSLPRGRSALDIRLDLGSKGLISCRDMALLRIEEIDCGFEDSV